jgi:hypothetical protein
MEIGHDILPVRTSFKELNRRHLQGSFLWLILGFPLLAYAGAFFGMKFYRKSTDSVSAAKAKKAARVLMRKCRQPGLTANTLSAVIREYLNDRLTLTLGSLTSYEAAEILRSRGVDFDTADRLRGLIEKLEDAVYTGKGEAFCDLAGDIPDIVKSVEREIR